MSAPKKEVRESHSTALKHKIVDSKEKSTTPDNCKSNVISSPIPPSPSPLPSSLSVITLTEGQQKAVDAVLLGHNVYIGGVSGSGKSSIIRLLCDQLQAQGKLVGVLAYTGLAAALIHGSTIHSFLGITVNLGPDTDKAKLFKSIKKNIPAVNRMKTTNIFIFDELSYISSYSYCIYEHLVRNAKEVTDGKPWGGAQVVFLGDFRQLPPFGDYNKKNIPWLFLSKDWRTHITHYFHLHTVLRQQDPDFIEALSEIREGIVSAKTNDFFQRVAAQPPLEGPVTHLFAKRNDVDRHNKQEMDRLPFKEAIYYSKTTYYNPEYEGECTLVVPEEITIKKGATVMLTRNVDLEGDLVNGTLGVVQGFCRASTWMQFYSEPSDAQLNAPRLEFDGGDNIPLGVIKDPLLPVVQWSLPGSSAPKEYTELMRPYTFKMTDAEGKPILTIIQLPFVLAYAMTFHKAQGQTLTGCVVHLDDNLFHPCASYPTHTGSKYKF